MTDIEQEARTEALDRYSHANVRDRYDADLLMAGFADGAMWAASRAASQEPNEAEVRTVAEAIREEMAADGDFDPTYDYTDDAMRYARAALRAVPGGTNGGRA